MPADAPAHVIGVDPDRDSVTASVVEASTTAEVAAAAFTASRGGYVQLLEWADRHTSTEQRTGRSREPEDTGRAWPATSTMPASGSSSSATRAQRRPATAPRPTPSTPAAPRARCWASASRASRAPDRREALRLPKGRGSQLCELKPCSSPLPSICATSSGAHHSSPSRQVQRPQTSTVPRRGARRHQTGPEVDRPADQDTHRGDRPTRSGDPPAHQRRRPPAARPARRRPHHRRPDLHRLVPPRAMPQRGRVRPPRRGRAPRSLLRADNTPPPQPPRRPQPQPGTAHHRHHPQPTLPPHPGLHRQKNQRGQNHTRSPALPQTLHRPPALPTPTAPTNHHLTNIEASAC